MDRRVSAVGIVVRVKRLVRGSFSRMARRPFPNCFFETSSVLELIALILASAGFYAVIVYRELEAATDRS